MRADRFITLSFARPFARAAQVFTSHDYLPILMYHSVSNTNESERLPYYRLATNPQRFADHMRWLCKQGYKGLSLEEALAESATKKKQKQRLVAITFDDGFRDFHTTAFPILECHKFTATVYLPTGFIAERRKAFNGRECMTWNEVRELQQKGIRFGSHTVTHPKLHTSEWAQIENEVKASKRDLERELGKPVTSFSYPYAFPQEDDLFKLCFSRLLHMSGYRTCVTTMIGRNRPNSRRDSLKRLPVNSCDDCALFAAKLEGAYDWLGVAQSAYRHLKRNRRSTV